MKIATILIIVYTLVFIALFLFFNRENKNSEEKDSVLQLIFVASLFSVVLTAAFAFFWFLIIGSTSAIDKIFNLNITTNQMVIIGLVILIYMFSLDNLVEIVFEYIFGDNLARFFAIALTRVAVFYIIGMFTDIPPNTMLIISIGVTVSLLILEVLYFYRNNTKSQAE